MYTNETVERFFVWLDCMERDEKMELNDPLADVPDISDAQQMLSLISIIRDFLKYHAMKKEE